MKIITFANKKGGVAKTTSSINVAAAYGFAGRKVLFIDSDSQCNSTETLMRGKTTYDPRQIRPSIYDVLTDVKKELPLDKAIRGVTREDNVHLIPSSQDMDSADVALSRQSMWGMALQRRRREIEELGYDVVVIDTPPGSAYTKTIALYAADLVIIPTVASSYSIDGLSDLIEEIAMIRDSTGKRIDFRILLVRMDGTRVAMKAREDLEGAFGKFVFQTEIPEATMVQRAEEKAASLLRHAPMSKPAIAYAELFREVDACLND